MSGRGRRTTPPGPRVQVACHPDLLWVVAAAAVDAVDHQRGLNRDT
jgi:hypothetical protein